MESARLGIYCQIPRNRYIQDVHPMDINPPSLIFLYDYTPEISDADATNSQPVFDMPASHL